MTLTAVRPGMWYTIHGKCRDRGKLQVVGDEAPLRRADVVRRDDQQRVGARFRRVLGELTRFRAAIASRLRRLPGHVAQRSPHGDVDQPIALLDA